MTVFSSCVYAASVPSASGQINSYDGAILRGSSSTGSAVLCVLEDDTRITIHKEVFKSKTSTAKKKKWYYVTANGIKGYVRSDLVDHIKYSKVTGKVKSGVNYRKGPGTEMKKAGNFKKGSKVTVVMKANPVLSVCGSNRIWYKVKSGSKYYYVCSDKVKLTGKASKTSSSVSDTSNNGNIEDTGKEMSDEAFEKFLDGEGFHESYKKKLRKLHDAHPNWGFRGYVTGISWKTALSKQTRKGTSLVSGSYPKSYRDGSKQYEKGWYKADRKVVAYYMDPRNFLNGSSIYMFEDLSYRPEYQTVSVVRAILSPSKLPENGFTAKVFVKAGEASNVSPVFLASRARQESGSGGDAVNGTKILGKKVYNPFNIGAFGGTNPLYNGLIYAYGKGWTTPAKATEGGAKVLAKNYIDQGQYTIYYQRFNLRNGENKVGTHQYMTNIMAPYSEALSTKNSYVKYGITDQPLVFEIPIYNSMPKSTKLP
ncbi:MAG: hypothetical protein IJJ06_10375 [Mogibacterium sp.]|nr:hypothetical protein [Mogibacterium sp.]